jgi:two-component system response regulator
MAEDESGELLLVEDSSTDAEMTQRALRKTQLAPNVRWVRDGAAALDYVFCRGEYAGRDSDQKPKLVLLDLKMPKVSGIEVLRAMKGDEQARTIPVVVMTSSAEDRDVAECYKLGVNSYIVKPVESGKFVETVTRLGLYWLLTNTTTQR